MNLEDRSSSPAVTIVMAAYNAERFISRSIESVLNQTYTEWEMICVNDGSLDKTYEHMLEYQSCDRRINIINLRENVGQALALCRAYQVGTGAFYLQLDADDWLDPDCLRTLYCEALENRVDCVTCDVRVESSRTGEFMSFYDGHNLTPGMVTSGRDGFAMTFPWRIPGACLWSANAAKAVAANEEKAIENEYVTRELFLASERVLIGRGIYFYSDTPFSASKAPTLKLLRKLRTIEALVSLAQNLDFSSEVVLRILEMQRFYIVSFTVLCGRLKRDLRSSELEASVWRIDESQRLWEANIWRESNRASLQRYRPFFVIAKLRLRRYLATFARPFSPSSRIA